VSIDTADDIITAIGQKSNIDLSWHRLRHTWAEQVAETCLEKPNGLDLLMYLGGWSNPLSVKRYIQQTVSRKAAELLRTYQNADDCEDENGQ